MAIGRHAALRSWETAGAGVEGLGAECEEAVGGDGGGRIVAAVAEGIYQHGCFISDGFSMKGSRVEDTAGDPYLMHHSPGPELVSRREAAGAAVTRPS